MDITTVSTPNAPAAGDYSQAVVYNGLVFVAGQLAIDPHTRDCGHEPLNAAARNALELHERGIHYESRSDRQVA